LWHVGRSGGFDAVPLDISTLVDNGMVFIEGKQGAGGQNLALFAMRASDGKLLWSKSQGVAPGPMVNQPQIIEGMIYADGNVGGLDALRESDGSLMWQHTGDQVYSPVFVADGRVQLSSGDTVLAISARDGTVLWRHSTSFHSTLASGETPETVDNGIVYIATTNGTVQALNASDGHTLWQYVIQELAVSSNPIYGAFQWKPQGSSVDFSAYHQLVVTATVNSAPLWFNRLQATPGITEVQADGPHSCPMMRYDPKALNRLKPDAPVTYVKATFSNSISYDTALDAVNNLGFRLANPCYEKARAGGDKPAWKTAGQENVFGSSHTLLLATTGFNATTWQQQLKSLAGVTKVDVWVGTGC